MYQIVIYIHTQTHTHTKNTHTHKLSYLKYLHPATFHIWQQPAHPSQPHSMSCTMHKHQIHKLLQCIGWNTQDPSCNWNTQHTYISTSSTQFAKHHHSFGRWFSSPCIPCGCIIPQAVTHSLVLLKMGRIIARNMLSWLELLISRYCCIQLVVYIIYISLYFFDTCYSKLHEASFVTG